MSSATGQAPPPPPPPQEPAAAPGAGGIGGMFSRIVGVFTSPAATFRDIGRAPGWLLPLLFVVAVSVAFNLVVSDKIDIETGIRASMEQAGLSGQQLEDALASQMSFWSKYGKIVGVAFSVVGIPIILMLLSLIFWGGTSAFGGRITFGITMTVICYAWMVKLVEGTVFTLAMLGRDPVPSNMLDRVLPTNPASFMNASAQGTPLYALAAALSLFTLWFMFLTATGLSAAGKLSRGGAFGLVGLLFGLWVLLSVGGAAIF